MSNVVRQRPVKLHCGRAMDTWRNSRWHPTEKQLVPVRYYTCLVCGHQEFEWRPKR